MRLDKFLTETTGCTRSQAKAYIKQQRVRVGNDCVRKPETKIDEYNEEVYLDSKMLCYKKYEYYMLNKPAGVVSATTDKREKTVISLIDSKRDDLFPVGRLDKDTEGLLLITNNGELAHSLLSPKRHVDKVYFARIEGKVTEEVKDKFAEGLKVDEEFTALPAKLEIIKSADLSEIKITIREGKFHQIKRMFQTVGLKVIYLKRLSMKNLLLDENLSPGEYRELTENEIKDLF